MQKPRQKFGGAGVLVLAIIFAGKSWLLVRMRENAVEKLCTFLVFMMIFRARVVSGGVNIFYK